MVTCLRVHNWRIWAARRLLEVAPESELMLHADGRVTACSGGLGVSPGMALARAQALAPGCVFAEDPGLRLELVWEEAVERVNQITPRLEATPGLLWARLERSEVALLTESLRSRSGLANDRSSALLASCIATDGNCVEVRPGTEHAFADAVPTLRLCDQLDVDTVQRLIWLGFPRVGQIRRLTRPQLEARFTCGSRLFWLSRPDPSGDFVSVYHPPPMLRATRYTDDPWTEIGPLLEALKEILQELQLAAAGQKASFLTLILNDAWRERRILKEPSSQLGRWWTPLRSTLEKHLQTLTSCEVERLTVEAGGLLSGSVRQLSMFRTKETIQTPLRTLERRYPGKVQQLDWHAGGGLLPEECWSYRPADGKPR
jgi:hypothetical protein